MKRLKSIKSPYTQTQMAILSTLIDMVKNRKPYRVTLKSDVRTEEEFIEFLRGIARLELKYNTDKEKIAIVEKKLDALEKTLKGIRDNSSGELLTYQLQYALYELSKKRLTEQMNALKKAIENYKKLSYRIFERISFNSEAALSDIKKAKAIFNQLDDEIERLKLEQDRLMLTGDSRALSAVSGKLTALAEKQDSVVLRIIGDYMIAGFARLKRSKTPSVSGYIDEWIGRLRDPNNRKLAEDMNALFYYIMEKKLGRVKTFVGNIKRSVRSVFSAFVGLLVKPIFSIGSSRVSILSILIAIFVFILGVYAGRIYKVRIKESKFGKSITLSTRTIIANVGYYTIILITFFIGLRIIGVNLSSLTVILGALSVGIGFGLQNMVSNFISGIILMLENSIRIGDYVEISQDLKGVVKDIQMRSTTIVTNDNIEVIVPNQTLFQNNVINWTLTEKVRRFRIPFSVAYGTRVEDVIDVVLGALEKSDLNYLRNVKGREPEVKMVAMNDSSVDFNLDVWVAGDDVLYPRKTTSRFLIMIYNALYEHGIQIPFPQLDVHFKEPLVVKKDK